MTTSTTRTRSVSAVVAVLALASCGSDSLSDTSEPVLTLAEPDPSGEDVASAAETSEPAADDADEILGDSAVEDDGDGSADASSFRIEVWADNWSAVYVDGELIGEDSVPITIERSFNSETFTFDASPPFTLAIEAKDFKETDSGIEYIGEQNQQMGDGGIIAQVTDLTTGEVVAVTDSDWSALVVHQAPLNTECERDPDPDETCEFSIVETPSDWTSPDFDDSAWSSATEWSEADVDPKDGYDGIDWDPAARLIWGVDLEVDNTILLRTTVS